MIKETLTRILKAGWINFRRHSYVSVGTTGVMVMVLLLFMGLATLNFFASGIIKSLEDKVDVSVYFKPDAGEDVIMKVKSDLVQLPAVKNVEYISPDQALADFKARHAGDALIQESLNQLEANPLQATLNVKAQDTSQYSAIVGFLEANKFRSVIDKINFYENEAVIGRVQHITSALQNWGLAATLMLAVIAVLVTFNTIRLTIYNQKQEIEIMRLVGGSNWHIRMPYMVEGAIYGGLATVVAIIIFIPTIYWASPRVALLMPGTSLTSYYLQNGLEFAAILLLLGISLGVLSSVVAIRKFLKI